MQPRQSGSIENDDAERKTDIFQKSIMYDSIYIKVQKNTVTGSRQWPGTRVMWEGGPPRATKDPGDAG